MKDNLDSTLKEIVEEFEEWISDGEEDGWTRGRFEIKALKTFLIQSCEKYGDAKSKRKITTVCYGCYSPRRDMLILNTDAYWYWENSVVPHEYAHVLSYKKGLDAEVDMVFGDQEKRNTDYLV